MRVPLLGLLMVMLAVAMLSPTAIAADIKIDDSINSHWITTTGTWATGTSASNRFGKNYYYCNQNPENNSSVTFTPNLPPSIGGWEVYIWYPAGGDRSTQTEVIIHHLGVDEILHINQQQNGGMWVYLGTYNMSADTSNYVTVNNNGTDTSKIVVADAVRFYSASGDRVPPIISNISPTPGSVSAVITWVTDEPAMSQIEYGTTTSYSKRTELDSALVKNHSVSITGLEPEMLYHFRVMAEDGSGNVGLSTDQTFTTLPVDNIAPQIFDLAVVPGANSAVVMWITDEPATSQVDYGTSTTYGGSTQVDTRLVTSHKVVLTGLTPSTSYHLRARSADGAANTKVSPDLGFSTTGPDSTAPVISEVDADEGSYSAVINWVTDEYSTSQVEYGLTSSYGSASALDRDLTRNHAVSLSNLEPSLLYHYRVISTDGSGNTATSGDYTFTTQPLDTTPPVISAIKAEPESRRCVITWTTNEAASSMVHYGPSNPPNTDTNEDTALLTSHSVTLTGLIPGTKYYFSLSSWDASRNRGDSDVFSFTTKPLDEIPPTITEITAEPGSNSVIITWLTDEPATSQVAYGETTAYGSLTLLDSVLGTYHRVIITELNSDTTYHFCVISRDEEGNETVSEDQTFTTSGPDTTAPVISEITVSRNMTSAVIRWLTNEPATSQVEYGTTTSYGSQTAEDNDLVTAHSVTLTGLETDVLYHFRVKSTDGAENSAVSDDHEFRTSLTKPEYRMVWTASWFDGFLTPQQTTDFVDAVAAANYNAIVAEVRKAGDAYYLSAYEPWATNIADGYDPLADLITKAHARGIEVHAWIVTFRAWYQGWPDPPSGHVWDAHGPDRGQGLDWSMRDAEGNYQEPNSSSLNIDPGVPGVQEYVANIVKDIATKYPLVDGVNFDYVRYPGLYWGYNDITRERFKNEYGYYPPTDTADPNWGVWCDYRRQQVTDLVKKCFVEAMSVNPQIKMSVDTVGWMEADPNTNYTATRQYAEAFQDARGWMNQHIIDINILMNYKREFNSAQKADYRLWADWLPRAANASGRLAVDGQGAYLNSISGTMAQMRYSRNAGSNGTCTYAYHATNKDGQPTEDFLYAVSNNLYTTPAPVPDMPWKEVPTTGIVFGTISDSATPNDPIYGNRVYKATVMISGPVQRTTLTDATGTYAFLDLPPGVYTVSVGKTGYGSASIIGIVLSAGDVLRRDASIEGTRMITSQPGNVSAGWNLISVPVRPLDPDPTVVLSGISLHSRLYRWDRDDQGVCIYDEWTPEAFGNITPNEGYWLETTEPAIISYQPAAEQPQSFPTVTLNKRGWSIMGLPSLADKDWNRVEVTHNGVTVSIETAREWLWLDTILFWWNNSVPGGGLDTVGVDDDYQVTSMLQPWHGYWIKTNLNDITLTFH